MMTETVVSGGVAVVRIRDERHRNALSAQLVDELCAQAERTDVCAYVLTGSAGYFSAGADVAELLSGNWIGAEPSGPPLLFRRMTEDPRPWIAAVNGPAIGGGCELALSCDFVLMASSAWLKLPEASLGVLPNTATKLLPATAPNAFCMQTLLGLERVTARRAVELGMANAEYQDAELDEAALAFARTVLSSVSPAAFRLVKEALRTRAPLSWRDANELLTQTDPEDVGSGIEAMQRRQRIDFTTRWTTHYDGSDRD